MRAQNQVVRFRSATLVIGVLALTGLLAGCTGGDPEPTPAPTTPAAVSEEPVEQEPAPIALVPEGTAADNLPFFTSVVQQVWAGENNVSSRAYVDALTAAGFDRGSMQATYDMSTVELPAESIQFSVRWGDGQCLVGQVGPSTGEPVTALMDELAEGRCLIGSTMPIDW